ncbi:transcription termination factor Rho [Nocardia puris]|uniref:Transcription termination factor Rho n=1 Tax=Nocardia puris TaxID=208602 RepID=A0A366DHR5_9NOCA|nr:transcription termination factor Rho [Nocardia puris]MBF6369459.1 transcription termination factor Rho [Nocardia puris]MBF6462252.1 transcription termination factor Rho [Nocardia puris]RBO89561.1 transcription termination factor Rho [Nocardia puris]
MQDNTIQNRDADDRETVTGILDITGNTPALRVEGYLPGPGDAHVPTRLIREHGLRRGDTVVGTLGPRRDNAKLPPLARVDSVNGLPPEKARNRPHFGDLVPIYPRDRLRLETESHEMITRATDLAMPIGKGQRALVVAPPKAGKTTVLQSIAHGIAKNHPECHLMLVLVGERPEEVTDLSRAVPADVAAATFDLPAPDHIALAELAIEHAKRLVEMGRDVVVLLDSLTRLARAYNLAATGSGRILSGGVDAGALAPPKKFLGAARNIEHGGSLTIIATALVETGSLADTVIFEEYKGTGNAELKLDRQLADRRLFPAIDLSRSSTRKEELLLTVDELAATHSLRKTLSGREPQQALELLLTGLRQTETNAEFLAQIIRAG